MTRRLTGQRQADGYSQPYSEPHDGLAGQFEGEGADSGPHVLAGL